MVFLGDDTCLPAGRDDRLIDDRLLLRTFVFPAEAGIQVAVSVSVGSNLS